MLTFGEKMEKEWEGNRWDFELIANLPPPLGGDPGSLTMPLLVGLMGGLPKQHYQSPNIFSDSLFFMRKSRKMRKGTVRNDTRLSAWLPGFTRLIWKEDKIERERERGRG